ncbi:MAG: tetratricopeptide repeat protein [Defluviicoccus sp.]|nr:tetratricopeptide repeat protein [Defluviicoccus sp.]MDE0384519.1 tetratricopeptide repeat protein [Defluviicoccus sp.]
MRWILAACWVSAALVWPGAAPAADEVDEVLVLVQQERYAEARETIDSLLRRDPGQPRVRLINGILTAREGHPTEAIAIFERLRDDHPDMFEPYNNLAVLYAQQDRLADALGALKAASERKPDAVVYANLGDIYTRLARRAYARARDIRTHGRDAAEPSGSSAPIPVPSAKPIESAPEGGSVAESGDGPAPEPTTGPARAIVATGSEPVSDDTLSGECVRAGDFKDRSAATQAAAWMQSEGAEIIDIVYENRQDNGMHWVHLPPAASREAAQKTVRELRGKGVRDIAILRRDSRRNVVSLGVFGKRSNANRRVAQLEKLGYRVEVTASGKTVGEYAVRARAGSARAAFNGAWKSRFAGYSIRYVDCPARS